MVDLEMYMSRFLKLFLKLLTSLTLHQHWFEIDLGYSSLSEWFKGHLQENAKRHGRTRPEVRPFEKPSSRYHWKK